MINKLIITHLFLLIIVSCNHALDNLLSNSNAPWKNEVELQSMSEKFSKLFGPSSSLPDISKDCLEKVMTLSGNTQELIQYLDAAGKPGAGIFQGSHMMLGSYQECKQLPFSRLCTRAYRLNTTQPLSQLIAICTPNECSPRDLDVLVGYAIKMTNLTRWIQPDATTQGSEFNCEKDKTMSAGAIGTICLCSLLLLLALIGTVIDNVNECDWIPFSTTNKYVTMSTDESNGTANPVVDNEDQDEEKGVEKEDPPASMLVSITIKTSHWLTDFLLCFSMTKNTSAILRTDAPKGAILPINGIRTISMWWVILGHTFLAFISSSDNILAELQLVQRFTFLPIINGTFSVDSFFLLSGLLVSYLTMRRVNSKGEFPWLQYYLHRFLRLTPTYMFVILFTIYIYPMMGSGPLSSTLQTFSNSCSKYWWTNLLYINNFYPTDMQAMCINWSWYLANDMQFYVITPIIILIMSRLRWLGAFMSNGILLVASLAATIAITTHDGLPPTITDITKAIDGQANQNSMNHVYEKPYCRISPYLVGIVLGYAIYRKTTVPRHCRTMVMLIGWCLAIIVGLATVLGNWNSFRKGGTPMDLTEEVFYTTFTRFSWACTLAWIIYACHTGYGGLVNRFLSWRAFIPTSRLTYSAYLIHLLVMYLYASSTQVPLHYTDKSLAYIYAGFLTLSYACAFILALLVEYPLMNVEQLIFKKK